MPNWCNNVVTISHNDPAQIKRVMDAFQNGALFNEFVPVPAALLDPRAAVYKGLAGNGKDENDAVRAENRERYGYESWYDFRIAKWGTKWDVGGDDGDEADLHPDGKSVTLTLLTAWAPPTVWYGALCDDFGYSVCAYYDEPGMAFCGKWEDGVDDYYEYGECDSASVREFIGEDIDDVFNISENMAMWEQQIN